MSGSTRQSMATRNLFSDLTVNLHHAPLNGVNEAYIDHKFQQKSICVLFGKYKLGRVLPETVASGYCTFQKVAFDLKKTGRI